MSYDRTAENNKFPIHLSLISFNSLAEVLFTDSINTYFLSIYWMLGPGLDSGDIVTNQTGPLADQGGTHLSS